MLDPVGARVLSTRCLVTSSSSSSFLPCGCSSSSSSPAAVVVAVVLSLLPLLHQSSNGVAEAVTLPPSATNVTLDATQTQYTLNFSPPLSLRLDVNLCSGGGGALDCDNQTTHLSVVVRGVTFADNSTVTFFAGNRDRSPSSSLEGLTNFSDDALRTAVSSTPPCPFASFSFLFEDCSFGVNNAVVLSGVFCNATLTVTGITGAVDFVGRNLTLQHNTTLLFSHSSIGAFLLVGYSIMLYNNTHVLFSNVTLTSSASPLVNDVVVQDGSVVSTVHVFVIGQSSSLVFDGSRLTSGSVLCFGCGFYSNSSSSSTTTTASRKNTLLLVSSHSSIAVISSAVDAGVGMQFNFSGTTDSACIVEHNSVIRFFNMTTTVNSNNYGGGGAAAAKVTSSSLGVVTFDMRQSVGCNFTVTDGSSISISNSSVDATTTPSSSRSAVGFDMSMSRQTRLTVQHSSWVLVTSSTLTSSTNGFGALVWNAAYSNNTSFVMNNSSGVVVLNSALDASAPPTTGAGEEEGYCGISLHVLAVSSIGFAFLASGESGLRVSGSTIHGYLSGFVFNATSSINPTLYMRNHSFIVFEAGSVVSTPSVLSTLRFGAGVMLNNVTAAAAVPTISLESGSFFGSSGAQTRVKSQLGLVMRGRYSSGISLVCTDGSGIGVQSGSEIVGDAEEAILLDFTYSNQTSLTFRNDGWVGVVGDGSKASGFSVGLHLSLRNTNEARLDVRNGSLVGYGDGSVSCGPTLEEAAVCQGLVWICTNESVGPVIHVEGPRSTVVGLRDVTDDMTTSVFAVLVELQGSVDSVVDVLDGAVIGLTSFTNVTITASTSVFAFNATFAVRTTLTVTNNATVGITGPISSFSTKNTVVLLLLLYATLTSVVVSGPGATLGARGGCNVTCGSATYQSVVLHLGFTQGSYVLFCNGGRFGLFEGSFATTVGSALAPPSVGVQCGLCLNATIVVSNHSWVGVDSNSIIGGNGFSALLAFAQNVTIRIDNESGIGTRDSTILGGFILIGLGTASATNFTLVVTRGSFVGSWNCTFRNGTLTPAVQAAFDNSVNVTVVIREGSGVGVTGGAAVSPSQEQQVVLPGASFGWSFQNCSRFDVQVTERSWVGGYNCTLLGFGSSLASVVFHMRLAANGFVTIASGSVVGCVGCNLIGVSVFELIADFSHNITVTITDPGSGLGLFNSTVACVSSDVSCGHLYFPESHHVSLVVASGAVCGLMGVNVTQATHLFTINFARSNVSNLVVKDESHVGILNGTVVVNSTDYPFTVHASGTIGHTIRITNGSFVGIENDVDILNSYVALAFSSSATTGQVVLVLGPDSVFGIKNVVASASSSTSTTKVMARSVLFQIDAPNTLDAHWSVGEHGIIGVTTAASLPIGPLRSGQMGLSFSFINGVNSTLDIFNGGMLGVVNSTVEAPTGSGVSISWTGSSNSTVMVRDGGRLGIFANSVIVGNIQCLVEQTTLFRFVVTQSGMLSFASENSQVSVPSVNTAGYATVLSFWRSWAAYLEVSFDGFVGVASGSTVTGNVAYTTSTFCIFGQSTTLLSINVTHNGFIGVKGNNSACTTSRFGVIIVLEYSLNGSLIVTEGSSLSVRDTSIVSGSTGGFVVSVYASVNTAVSITKGSFLGSEGNSTLSGATTAAFQLLAAISNGTSILVDGASAIALHDDATSRGGLSGVGMDLSFTRAASVIITGASKVGLTSRGRASGTVSGVVVSFEYSTAPSLTVSQSSLLGLDDTSRSDVVALTQYNCGFLISFVQTAGAVVRVTQSSIVGLRGMSMAIGGFGFVVDMSNSLDVSVWLGNGSLIGMDGQASVNGLTDSGFGVKFSNSAHVQVRVSNASCIGIRGSAVVAVGIRNAWWVTLSHSQNAQFLVEDGSVVGGGGNTSARSTVGAFFASSSMNCSIRIERNSTVGFYHPSSVTSSTSCFAFVAGNAQHLVVAVTDWSCLGVILLRPNISNGDVPVITLKRTTFSTGWNDTASDERTIVEVFLRGVNDSTIELSNQSAVGVLVARNEPVGTATTSTTAVVLCDVPGAAAVYFDASFSARCSLSVLDDGTLFGIGVGVTLLFLQSQASNDDVLPLYGVLLNHTFSDRFTVTVTGSTSIIGVVGSTISRIYRSPFGSLSDITTTTIPAATAAAVVINGSASTSTSLLLEDGALVGVERGAYLSLLLSLNNSVVNATSGGDSGIGVVVDMSGSSNTTVVLRNTSSVGVRDSASLIGGGIVMDFRNAINATLSLLDESCVGVQSASVVVCNGSAVPQYPSHAPSSATSPIAPALAGCLALLFSSSQSTRFVSRNGSGVCVLGSHLMFTSNATNVGGAAATTVVVSSAVLIDACNSINMSAMFTDESSINISQRFELSSRRSPLSQTTNFYVGGVLITNSIIVQSSSITAASNITASVVAIAGTQSSNFSLSFFVGAGVAIDSSKLLLDLADGCSLSSSSLLHATCRISFVTLIDVASSVSMLCPDLNASCVSIVDTSMIITSYRIPESSNVTKIVQMVPAMSATRSTTTTTTTQNESVAAAAAIIAGGCLRWNGMLLSTTALTTLLPNGSGIMAYAAQQRMCASLSSSSSTTHTRDGEKEDKTVSYSRTVSETKNNDTTASHSNSMSSLSSDGLTSDSRSRSVTSRWDSSTSQRRSSSTSLTNAYSKSQSRDREIFTSSRSGRPPPSESIASVSSSHHHPQQLLQSTTQSHTTDPPATASRETTPTGTLTRTRLTVSVVVVVTSTMALSQSASVSSSWVSTVTSSPSLPSSSGSLSPLLVVPLPLVGGGTTTAISTTTTTAIGVGSLVSSVSLPVGALSLRRLSLLANLGGCYELPAIVDVMCSPVDFMNAPLQLRVGVEYGAWHRGAVIGDAAVWVGCVVVGFVLTLVARRAGLGGAAAANESIVASAARLRLPGLYFILVALLLQQVVVSSVLLLGYGGGSSSDGGLAWSSAVDRVIGACGLLLSCVIVGSVVRVLDPRRKIFRAMAEVVEPDENIRRWPNSVLRWLKAESVEWLPRRATRDALFVRRYGFLFESCCDGRHWWLLVDLNATLVLGVLGGVLPDSIASCLGEVWFAVALCCVQLVGLLVLRPLNNRIEFGIVVVLYILQVAVALCGALDASSTAMTTLSMVGAAMSGLLAVSAVLGVVAPHGHRSLRGIKVPSWDPSIGHGASSRTTRTRGMDGDDGGVVSPASSALYLKENRLALCQLIQLICSSAVKNNRSRVNSSRADGNTDDSLRTHTSERVIKVKFPTSAV